MKVGVEVEAQHRDGDEGAAGDAYCIGDDSEKKEHKDSADEAGRDELTDGVRAEGAHGVDLFGDFHRTQFRGHAGSVTAGDHKASQYGAKFLDHGERDERAGHADGAKLSKRRSGLQGKYAAGEKSGEDDDRQGPDAD